MKIEEDLITRTEQPKNETFRYWNVMSFYERFEQVVALVLSFLIAIIIVMRCCV